MPISKDELAQMNFGYLNGSDLMQFAPYELLSSQYNKFSSLFQIGCNQAYSEMISKLSTRYDIQREFSNANQRFVNQTGVVQVNIAAGSYISKIVLSTTVDSIIQIGTTSTGIDILDKTDILGDLTIWVNKIFPTATTLYFQIQGLLNFDITCNAGIISPPITVKNLLNQSVNFFYDLPANTYLYQVFPTILLSTPSISIGTTLGGSEIVPLTLVNNVVLPINSGTNYFASDTRIYFTITGGSSDIRMDIGFNFIAPTPILNPLREDLVAQITSILAIRNILGSISGDNTLLKGHFNWAYEMIAQIKNRQMNLRLNSPPVTMESRAYMIKDSFSMLG